MLIVTSNDIPGHRIDAVFGGATGQSIYLTNSGGAGTSEGLTSSGGPE